MPYLPSQSRGKLLARIRLLSIEVRWPAGTRSNTACGIATIVSSIQRRLGTYPRKD